MPGFVQGQTEAPYHRGYANVCGKQWCRFVLGNTISYALYLVVLGIAPSIISILSCRLFFFFVYNFLREFYLRDSFGSLLVSLILLIHSNNN